MSNHQRLDDEIRWRILGRLEASQCQVQICRELNLMPGILCNLSKQYQDTGSSERKPGQGRLRATTAREDHPLSIIASGACSPEFILMDYNARPHRALLVNEFLESEDISPIDWPARCMIACPGRSGEGNCNSQTLPRTIKEMKTVLMDKWDPLV
ncbi:DDE_3 domain-containing protein [Trichonephila clavipes]|nr:DDE_3 domain-containing protein [Trichonephila clavipes]